MKFVCCWLLISLSTALWDPPVPTSLIAPEQWLAIVDVGRDACEITHYEAIVRSPGGKQLRLRLTDRRSVVRLDCLTNITKGRPP